MCTKDIRWMISRLTSKCSTAKNSPKLRSERIQLFSFEIRRKAVDVHITCPIFMSSVWENRDSRTDCKGLGILVEQAAATACGVKWDVADRLSMYYTPNIRDRTHLLETYWMDRLLNRHGASTRLSLTGFLSGERFWKKLAVSRQ